MRVGKYAQASHEHISEMRVRINRRIHPKMTTEDLKVVVSHILDGEPEPEGIQVLAYNYGQTEPIKDGLSMLRGGNFSFISEGQGFGVSAKKRKK